MVLPVSKRDFDVFLSHAHVDRAFVDQLHGWLTEVAGLNVWYDAKQMAGQGIASGLKGGIERSRAAIVVASTEALSRGWVKQEVDVVLDERSRSQDFRVIALRLADAKADELVRGLSWIDVPDGKLTPTVAASILCGFHPVERWPDPSTSRDVYVSASWQSSDNASALAVCRRLIATGFRLIGDSRTQRGFSGDRVASIMASCGAAVVVIPYRGSDRARSGEAPYKYFLQEHDQAQALQLPLLVVADPRVRREDGDDGSWLRMPTDAGTCPPEIDASIEALWEEWRGPTRRHLAFYATDLTAEAARRGSDVRRVLELVTGMPTRVGTDIQAPSLQAAIMRALGEAFLVVADITGNERDRFNIDVCIEAGMALAAGSNVELMAAGDPRSPPFMLRGCGQLTTYRDEVEQLGSIRRIAWGFRRRVINTEL
ncbi:MAG TPA: toll/interleukin-1 receptor domain-containing protein [Geminicoccaceae bacterium]|nr:toll/interleukin-1 receptor domain-containing protein [Geminicoccaceae bacterium]